MSERSGGSCWQRWTVKADHRRRGIGMGRQATDYYRASPAVVCQLTINKTPDLPRV